jgi:5-amino-6-(5-phospho-D-ribitylamino)uracil phosphatase
MPTIYISDLDGTLLRSDATLSAFSKSTLDGLLAEGILFTVASARSVTSIRPILDGLTLPLPIIEFNGAFITDLGTGRHAIINDIDRDLAEGIFDVIRKSGSLPFVSTYDGTADRVYYEKILNDGMQQHLNNRRASHDPRLRKIDRLADAFSDRVVCLTVIDRSEVVVKVRKAIEEAYPDQAEMHFYEDTYAPGWSWLTVNDLKATKGRAIQTLTRLAGLDDGEIVAFGDHTNDIEMFRVAHRSFAVADAKDELKTRATGTIGSNEEDSVIRFIQADCRERTPAG